MMKIVLSTLLSIVWGAAGMLVGAAFAYALNFNMTSSLITGYLVGSGMGFLYGILAPTTHRSGIDRALSEVKNRLALEKCAWCKGTGIESQKRSKRKCPVCLGAGRFLTEQPTRFCPRCRGKGRLFAGRRCSRCEGTGLNTFYFFDRVSGHKGRKQAKKKRRWGWRINTM
ncbi:MAG: hypothetical protein KDJ52_25875 [Anaerolineae bacterium]|nr:hypothetical protein [Anaerolineae bacterium]